MLLATGEAVIHRREDSGTDQQQLIEFMRTRPFRPFCIHVSDVASYDVRHPDVVLVTPSYAIVGSPAADRPLPAIAKHDVVDLFHIIRLEPIQTTTTS